MIRIAHILTFISFFTLSTVVFAQNSGFGGKRFLVKTDIINGTRSPLFSLATEVMLTKNFTFTAGGRILNGKYKQKYFIDEYTSPSDIDNGSYGESSAESDLGFYDVTGLSETNNNISYKMPEKASISSKNLSFELRWYKNHILPAPHGNFFYVGFDIGTAKITKGQYERSLNENVNPTTDNNKYDFPSNYYSSYYSSGYDATLDTNSIVSYTADKRGNIKGINFSALQIGYGYQKFLSKYITLGFKIGLVRTFFNYNTKWDPQVVSGVAKTFGPNMFRIASFNSHDKNYQSGTQGNLGVNFNVQLGFLIK